MTDSFVVRLAFIRVLSLYLPSWGEKGIICLCAEEDSHFLRYENFENLSGEIRQVEISRSIKTIRKMKISQSR